MLHGLSHTCILKDNVSLLNKWIFFRGASRLNTGHYPISSDMPLYLNNSTVDIMLNTTLSLGVKRNEIISLNLSLARDLEDNKWSKENKMCLNTEETKTLLISAKHLRNKKKGKKAVIRGLRYSAQWYRNWTLSSHVPQVAWSPFWLGFIIWKTHWQMPLHSMCCVTF